MNAVASAQEFLRSLTNVRAQMYGIDKVYIRITVGQTSNRTTDVLHRLTVIFTAMCSHKNDAVVLEIQCLQCRVTERKVITHGHVNGVYYRIAADQNAIGDLFTCQIVAIACGRCKMQIGNLADQLAVHLFRERRVFIVGAQTGFYMSDRDLVIKCCKCTGKGGRSVAMYQNDIRLGLFQHGIQTMQRLFGNGCKRLTLLHDIQIIVGLDIENIQHLIEHLTMLCRYTDNALGMLVLLQCVDQRSHLNRFRTGAENGHDFNVFHGLPVPFFHARIFAGSTGYARRLPSPESRPESRSLP